MDQLTYAIKILDQTDHLVGEMMTASYSDVSKFIDKGFKVIDITNGSEISKEDLDKTIGVSDGAMIVG